MAQGSKPGERRGGRVKGTPNKVTAELRLTAIEKLREMGCDPIEGMATIAMDTKCSKELRGKLYAELAQYIYPKLTRAEMSGMNGSQIEHEMKVVVRYVGARNKPA